MRNKRMTVAEAVELARTLGIRTRRMGDGHYLFFLDNNRTVNVNQRSRTQLVPPRLTVALRRAMECKA